MLRTERYKPYAAGLPEICYAKLPNICRIVVIRAGTPGVIETCSTSPSADELNSCMGVSPQQQAAMMFGAVFGWYHTQADPAFYSVASARALIYLCEKDDEEDEDC